MTSPPAPSNHQKSSVKLGDWLVGGAQMGKCVRQMDWSKTPLGPIEKWPQSLRTTVGLCLASNFPISIAWGTQHTQIYNDGYWPICGGKHPSSMGQNFRECWASAWPVIGDAFERGLAGETSFLEDQRMFLDRHGYLEETFFTFSFSPIRDESGGIGGLFHPVTETTGKMIAERRTRALRDLASRASKAKTTNDTFVLATQTLAEYALDIPFAQFYLIEGKTARLTAQTGPLPPAIAFPTVDLVDPKDARWPIAEVVQSSRFSQVNNLERRFGPFACGPYIEPPKTALILPIIPAGCAKPIAVLVIGVSSRLPLNEEYHAFLDLITTTVTSAASSARAYEEERRRAEALAEIDRAKTAFFSNVSHEFRTPITLMLGPIEDELAERSNPLPPARRERLETAHRNTVRLLKLVNTLLDFSRLEAGRVQASFEPTDLAAYTAELASGFRSAIEKAKLTLTIKSEPLPKALFVDHCMWEKIVLNLLSNAFKHTFAGGIRISLKPCGEHVELAVSDSGVGISEAELPKLFERFHRVKGAKSRTHEGTGIGLALVVELARIHGGGVRVISREGEGSTFFVTIKTGRDHLPAEHIINSETSASKSSRVAAYADEAIHWLFPLSPAIEGEAAEPAQIRRAATFPEKRARVLWADDNADMRGYVSRILEHDYEVVAVADGAAALEVARATPPDLVLTDVMMPRLDGFGLLRELRRHDETETIPVILLSARAGEESAVEGLDAGADDYLVKPFSARELLARVRTHVELAKRREEWTRKLETANRDLESFSYSVSHDLRAPLRAIGGFAHLIQEVDRSLSPASQKYLQKIIAQTGRMNELITGLLALAQFSRQSLAKQSVNLTEVVRDVADELRKTDSNREIDFSTAELPRAMGDPALLRQVFANLLSNAFKFTRKSAHPRVEVNYRHEDELVYFVRDNGVGFDQKYASKLFGVFERLHPSDQFEGTGVGLSVVKRIIERHGGRIWAESEVDHGATFFFTLPLTDSRPLHLRQGSQASGGV